MPIRTHRSLADVGEFAPAIRLKEEERVKSAIRDKPLQQMIQKVGGAVSAAWENKKHSVPRPRPVMSDSGDLLLKKMIPEMLILDFYKGHQHYLDFIALTKSSNAGAERVFRLVIDYCEFDQQRYSANVERISRLPTTNPDDIEGIEELMMQFAAEFYMLMYHKRVFRPAEPGTFPYEFVRFAGSRIVLQRKKML